MGRRYESYLYIIIFIGVLLPTAFTNINHGKHVRGAVHISGNITLGGLFPIHSEDKNGKCSIINGVLGIQRLEAMLYAIKRINSDINILPGIELGLSAFDTCSSETTALDRTVEEFITHQRCDSEEDKGAIGGRQVVGIVGPLYSSVSVQVAHLLRLFKMPQISYDSTSSELSDKTKYKYFLRTVPSDVLQARAMVDILRYFGWSYVSAVYSDDNYGRNGIEALNREAENKGICFAVREKIPYPADNKTFERIISKLLAEKQARVLIVFCSKKETIISLLHAANAQQAVDQFQWIGSDAWITVKWLGELHTLIRGLISVQPKSDPVLGFNEYLFQRMPSSNDVNPWFREYFRETVKCNPLSYSGEDDYPNCNSKHTLRNANITIDNGVTRTIDAVYAYAHALDKIRRAKCGNSRIICDKMKETSGEDLLNVLKKIKFKRIDGRVAFDDNGDVPAKYSVYYFNKTGVNQYKNVRIGHWVGNLTMSPIAKQAFKPKDSFCGVQCDKNEVKLGIPGKPSCCWKCTKCSGNKFAYNQTNCKTCARGFWPDTDKQRCVQIPPRYFTLNTDYVGLQLVLPPLVVSILGIFSVIYVVVIFAKYNHTPLVKASGRELSYLLLTGLFFCYAALIVCLIKPSPYVCLVEFLLDSLPFTICYAAVIVKTNRISRIFNRRDLTKRPQFIHPQSQICFSFALVAVQVMLLTAFCLLQLPRQKLLNVSDSDVVLICAISDKDFLLSQIYNFVLILVCTYYAFKTRRSPMNFNEAKYIVFAMYCTCVLWLAFITVYVVQTDVMLKACIRCLSISLIATILLVCLFVPKVYIIIFKPSENRKRPTLPSHSISSLNGEQGASRPQGALHNEVNNSRDSRQNEFHDRQDGKFPRGSYRPRSSTDPRRFDNDRRSWRYSLPPEQFNHSTEVRKLEREEDMEMEMKALIERLAVLESLLHQQRQAAGSYQTREIQGTLKSCQGLIAEVKKHSDSSIRECVEDCSDDRCSCAPQNTEPKKPDNRSLLMTYAESSRNSRGSKDSETTPVGSRNKKTNGNAVTISNTKGLFKNTNSKEKNDKMGLLQYPMSPLKRKSASAS